MSTRPTPSFVPIPENRNLTAQEADLVRWLLEHGGDEARSFLPQLQDLRVASRCGCGCASIDFIPDALGAIHPFYDYQWRSADGDLFGIFVFSKRGVLAGLEVWSIDGNATPTTLPSPGSLQPIGTPET